MSVHDRLEDARRRRKELLAKGNGPAPRTAPNPRASSQSTPPQPRMAPVAPNPESAAHAVVAPVMAPPTPKSAPIAALEAKRTSSGYWRGLLQAMAAIALIAVLIAVFRPFAAQPETPATVAAPLAPEPVVIAPIAETSATAVTVIPATIEATTAGLAPLTAPEPTDLGLTIAPLISPTFESATRALSQPTADDIPFALNPDGAPALPLITPPLVLASTPPVRPRSETAIALAAPVANTGFAQATNVVLMVPAFVPQSTAEEAVAAAAAIGIPVDQTRRASVSIRQTNIRYYHAEDAEAATILASGLGGIARDFTSFTPSPNPGVIEVWLQGRSGSTTSNQGSATGRGIQADLAALRNTIARALGTATGN